MIDIQPAKKQHLQEIVALLANDQLGVTRETTGPLTRPYTQAFEKIQQDPNAQILIALKEGNVIGCLQLNIIANLTFGGATRGQIEGVRVSPSAQGQGVGRQLFEKAIQICQSQGCKMVQLTTNNARPDAAIFYEKLGFTGSHMGFKLMLDTS